jgi:nitrite reductase/ring-hydroxylating ferredoxin subunit
MPVAAPTLRIFREYVDKASIQTEVMGAFLAGIELLAGRECRQRCERGGLATLHQHYPAEYVHLLEAFVSRRVKRRMLEWSAAMGKQDLGYRDDFLVEDLLVVRVHYPHSHIGVPSDSAVRPRLRHRVRYGTAAALERARDAYDSKGSLKLAGRVVEYSRQRRKRAALPLPYRCHAPHLDSWLGQPMTSLSVWLAIAGVDRDNSLCLYPDTYGKTLPFNGAQFLGTGLCLPKPMRPDIADGDLFVFSTDILHGSQLNVSNKTRIALTTRIDPGTPTFSKDSLWFVQRWYSSKGIERRRWHHTMVGAAEHSIERPRDAAGLESSRSIAIERRFLPNEPYEIGPSTLVPEGGSIAVQFDNKRILILRANGDLRAISAICPHEGYRLDEGYHDACTVVCPGHGLEFDTRTGQSALARYRLSTFKVHETAGTIFVVHSTAP